MSAPWMPAPGQPVIDPHSLLFMEVIAALVATNPFDPKVDGLLQAALPGSYIPRSSPARSRRGPHSNNFKLLAEPLAMTVIPVALQLASGALATPREMAAYRDAALYAMWDEFGAEIQALIDDKAVEVTFYDAFKARYDELVAFLGMAVPEPGRLLEVMYQARRAWHFASTLIRGESPSARAARAAIWWAILGSDLHAYADGVYRRLDRMPVLITGETGTGKELAAKCVAWSRYLPFDPTTRRFAMRYDADRHARNLGEVPRELLESALFGHRRGSFTGAVADSTGFFGLPGRYGTLCLDEVGEIPEHVQVMLLRPLESREYVPIGEAQPRAMLGRLIFSTNRDLEALCREGRFRPDLLERMNGVRIHLPPLRQMLAEAPEELRDYVRGFVADTLDNPVRVETWTERIVDDLAATRRGHRWSRNLRELKHHVERYILTGGHMAEPLGSVTTSLSAAASTAEALGDAPPEGADAPPSACIPSSGILGERAKAGEISLEELSRALVTNVYARTDQNKAETARRTGLSVNTVARKIDPARLARALARQSKK